MSCIKSFTGKYRFLSNFHPVPIEYEGVEYSSVEVAYQAAKAKDTAQKDWFKDITDPGKAKKLGRRVDLRDDWEDVKIDIMFDLVRKKFSYPSMKKLLLDTKDAELIEGNWHGDRFWGMVDGDGKNMLGEILMDVREELKYEGLTEGSEF